MTVIKTYIKMREFILMKVEDLDNLPVLFYHSGLHAPGKAELVADYVFTGRSNINTLSAIVHQSLIVSGFKS